LRVVRQQAGFLRPALPRYGGEESEGEGQGPEMAMGAETLGDGRQ
jgi:hypothetical protein